MTKKDRRIEKIRNLEKRERKTLTVLFCGMIIAFIVTTICLAGVVIFLLVKSGIITGIDFSSPFAVRLILTSMIVNIIVGMIISFSLGRIPLKPVNKLINSLNRLAAGDYSTRLEYEGIFSMHPITKELTESFNLLAQELEGTEMLRSDFINDFSHEFKTPIVSISGFAKLLKRGNLTDEQKREYIDIIEEESMRLSSMSTNVLNLTKVENQTILTDVTEYNLSEQIRSCILLLEDKWNRKNIELSLYMDEHFVFGNEELLKQVWINLLDNAVKFSPEGSTVDVSLRESERWISVSVMNCGSEIPEEKQSKIFDKFYQVDESHSSSGNGVGLAIVKRIIELHEGTIGVKSKDQITAVTVSLPKKERFIEN